MTATATTTVRRVADVRRELDASLDFYESTAADYRASGYSTSNDVRLEELIRRLAKNPQLISSNRNELFNRVSIALLCEGE